MRLFTRFVLVPVALALLVALPGDAASHPAGVRAPAPQPFGAACRTAVEGSRVTVYCHNPYPAPDRLRLHVECVRWWDIDSDGAPVTAGPAETVRLTARCWKEVQGAWITHRR
ncbi:hypothetical protein [Streptomyces minutiscleroticus]|uniref:Secreted protein n=1 Tax=Streptomyces minutiscleroticus TaxID=68238 RepID=A0A918U087_9ACTN|nr:hypothetical protein [Streptomyces minutiscleroticus]GGX78611.1 hypothetical protein GCM10010358_36120 [Streptomyces minutiscleroticus]